MKTIVYLVRIIDICDNLPTVATRVFATKEKAQRAFNAEVKRWREAYDMDNNGHIENESDRLFSWTLNIGFIDNALEISLDPIEVE